VVPLAVPVREAMTAARATLAGMATGKPAPVALFWTALDDDMPLCR
jgi:hypothetical protein